ncbi:MAG: hypothetical protein ACLPWS_01830 [Rhodomicrobium sp.]
MKVKHHHFLLAAFILAIGALAGSPSAGANLAAGETRLPSGVVVRIDDAPSSAEEAKRRFEEKFGTTFEERRKAIEALISAAQADRLQTKLEIINALNYTVQSICDEYINYAFQPYTSSPPSSLKEVVTSVFDRQSSRSEANCVYKVAQWPKITRLDGSPLPDISFEKVQLDDQNTVSIASVSETNEIDIPLPIKEILIIVPFAATDLLGLAPYLTRVAQKLYDAPAYKGTLIRFVAAEKNVQESTYKSLGIMVWAFRTVSGAIVFVESVRLVQGKNFPVIGISAWSFNLTEAAAAGLNSETLRNYFSKGVNRDATEVFDLVGRYAAESFKVSQVGVGETTVPGSKYKIGVPVVFECDNGVWRITNERSFVKIGIQGSGLAK